jgi:membrane protein DedA with SNARE-associated domain
MQSNVLKFLILHPLILKGGYVGMFLIMLIEGPIITAFGGFAARIGIMNVWIVLMLSILGNFIPDVVFYTIGFWARESFIDKYGPRFGISKERMRVIEKLYEDHAFLTLLVIKLLPLIPPTGLAAAGAARMPLAKYSLWSMIIILITSGLYLATGYYAGEAYVRVVRYQEWALAVFAVCIPLSIWGFNKATALFGKKLAPSVGLSPAELEK